MPSQSWLRVELSANGSDGAGMGGQRLPNMLIRHKIGREKGKYELNPFFFLSG
jgi:hypothetical protein